MPCDYSHQFHVLQMLGWRKKCAHAQAGSQTKTVSTPENPSTNSTKKLYGPSDNVAHSWPVWNSNVTSLTRSLVGDASPTVNSSRIQTPHHRNRPFTSEPKWTEAPYSPPNIERHDVYTFNRGINGKSYKQRTTTQLNATGCSSVPGWRQLRTLCKSRLAESYFLFTVILLPPRAVHRFYGFLKSMD